MKPTTGNCRQGFTLIELMVVILIIGILLGLLFPALQALKDRARKVQVANLISDSKLACESFRMENGQYPWTKPPQVAKDLAAGKTAADVAIVGYQVYAELRATTDAQLNTKQDYLGEVKSNLLMKEADGTRPRLKDVWDEEIVFRVNFNGLQAVIYSKGKNRLDETNDGASTDAAKYPLTYYYFGSGGTGDDLTNL